MFKLIPFEYQFCTLGYSHDLIADACRNKKEFWSFTDSSQFRGYKRSFENFLTGDITFYPTYYWIVFVLSLYGAMYSLVYFIRLFFVKETYVPHGMDKQKFYVVSPGLLRKLNFLKGFLLINVWVLLLYAVLFVSPPHMIPWLYVYFVISAFKLATATFATLFGHLKGEGSRILIYLGVTVVSTWLVNQAMVSFISALKRETLQNLMLYYRLLDPIK